MPAARGRAGIPIALEILMYLLTNQTYIVFQMIGARNAMPYLGFGRVTSPKWGEAQHSFCDL